MLSHSSIFRSNLSLTKARPWQRHFLAVTLTVFSMALMNPAIAQERMLRTLTVTGEAQERIPATKAQVQLGVEVRGENAAQVQQQVARQMSAVVELLRSRNVERLQTTGINLNPIYNYEDDQRQLIGYVGTNTVSFRVNAEQAGQILDQAVNAGATRIDNISLMASEEAIAEAQKEALRDATQDAREQADVVLNALNLNANEIVRIQLNGANVPPPVPMPRLEAASLAKDAVTPVIGGEQTVRASVTLEISY
ncbi:MAG: SIMPL domain-containing protein [Chroococcales cyanobacterium]